MCLPPAHAVFNKNRVAGKRAHLNERPKKKTKKKKTVQKYYNAFFIDGSRPESGRVFGKSGSRADSGRLFLIFFFFSKVGPSRKKFLKKKKSRPESKKKLGPSRPDSGPVGPHTVKSFPKKKKTQKKKNQKKFDSARLGPTFF